MRKTSLEKNPEKAQIYRFWVEPSGNNHVLVKHVIKRRNWMMHIDLSSESISQSGIVP